MFDWIQTHADVINAFAGVGMLIVWVTYLQVFLQSYRRQTLPKIVINRAAGSALDAYCFVSNMSSDSIYLESAVMTISVGDDEWECAVTDIDALDDREQPVNPLNKTHQRPLSPGSYHSLGSFDRLIDSVMRMRDGPTLTAIGQMDGPVYIEVMIIADYASEDMLIGAKRRFKIEGRHGQWYLEPTTVETTQIRSRKERKRITEVIARQP